MNIAVNLNKDFERFFNYLKEQYGEDFAELNGVSDRQLSFNDFIDNFVDKRKNVADTSVDSSSNVHNKDIVTLRSEMSKPHEKLLSYNKIFLEMKKKYGLRLAKKWMELEWNKALYLHDANTATFIPYCFAYDLTRLAEEGLFYLDDHKIPEPPKHLDTFVNFVKEFINFTSNRTSGACGLPNLIPYMYYFWKEDVKNDHYPRSQTPEQYAKSAIQGFIYAINQPYCRDGIQSAFVNTSIFSMSYLHALFDGAEFPNGEFMVDHMDGIMQFQKWFLEEMRAIKDRGRMFTFPVNTISLLKQDGEFDDPEFARWACNHNRKWNDSNIFADKDVTSLSNCCRLKSNIKDIGYFEGQEKVEETVLKEMHKNFGGMTFEEFCAHVKSDKDLILEKNKKVIEYNKTHRAEMRFGDLGYMNSLSGNALKVGSIKVSTINLARIAYEANNSEKKYLEILKDRLIIDMQMLDVLRHIIERNVEKDLLPNFQDGIIDFQHLYNTIGINGIYETMKTFGYVTKDEFGNTLYKDEAVNFGKLIFDTIHTTIEEFTSDKNYKVNVEQIPAESAAVKFMQADKMIFGKNKVVTDLPLYGNQWIPLGIKTTIKERIRICSTFDNFCNGGSICHINVDKPIESEEAAWDLLNYITDQGVTYFAFNGKYSTDDNNHLFYGDICPECGSHKTAEWTRTVGFPTKTSSWSSERQAEYKLREWHPLNDKGLNDAC